MPAPKLLIVVVTLGSLLGCRAEQSGASIEAVPSPVEPDPAEPSGDVKAWGADAAAPVLAELPAELAAQTYDPSFPSLALPAWQLARVETGTDPRPLGYRSAAVARQARFLLTDPHGFQNNTTLHWWSLANAGAELGFAGIDCGAVVASAEECMKVRGQVRRDGSRITQIAQTAGPPMSPAAAELLELFSVPLPSEPIGIGGAWTATLTTPTMSTTRRYRLLAVEGDQLTIELSADTKLVNESEESATGTLRVSVFDPLARSGSVELVSRSSVLGGPPTESTMTIELTTLEPGSAG